MGGRRKSEQSFHDREVGATPPQVRIRNRTRMNFESRIANHRKIFRRAPLHIHPMPKKYANNPRVSVFRLRHLATRARHYCGQVFRQASRESSQSVTHCCVSCSTSCPLYCV